MNNTAMDTFVKGYSDKNYKYPVLVRHKGSVIGFAMDDECRIWYTVLDLAMGNDERGALDVEYWLDDPRELPFTREIVQTGFSIVGSTTMPVVKKGGLQEDETGQLSVDEVDLFWSSTGRLTADAPFQVVSDNKHLYLFRQSRTVKQAGMVFKLNSGGASGDSQHSDAVLDNQKEPVPVVNDTLLCDRYVLSGTQLLAKQEVRYRRSRHKLRPASNKDTLGAKDMGGIPFFEPTQELDFISNLQQGRFSVLRLPTQVADIYRWQFFAYNEISHKIDLINMEQAEDGLFDTHGQSTSDGNVAMHRSSFSFSGRDLASGLSAALYHQQEEGADGRPVRTAARVMLSAATQASGDDKSYLATLDFAVSRQGLLTQVRDEVILPEVDNSQAEVLEKISKKEGQAQALRSEIRRLAEAPAKMAGIFDGSSPPLEIPITEKQAGNTYTVEFWMCPQKSTTTKSGYGWRGIPYNYEVTQDWYGVITHKGARLHHVIVHKDGRIFLCTKTTTTGNDVTHTDSPVVKWGQWQHVAVTCDGESVCIYVDGKKLKERKVDGASLGDSNAIYIGSEENQQGKYKGMLDDMRLWNHARSAEQIRATMRMRIKEPAQGLVGYWLVQDGKMQDFSDNARHALSHRILETDASPVPGSWADDGALRTQLDTLQAEIDQLKQGSLSGLSRALDYIHMDAQGLTLYGALLKFAHASETPQLLDSATGKLALYFRGSNGQFFAAYHDTQVSRHQKQLPLGNGKQLSFQAAMAGEEMDSYQIRVTESTAASLCSVLIEHEDDDMLSEQWLQVPREAHEFAQVLNGQHPGYDYATHASGSIEGCSLAKGSLCFRVVASQPGLMLVDGFAETSQLGATSRWVADAPGQACVFDGVDDCLVLPEAQQSQVALDSSLTMEAWLNPSATMGPRQVITQKTDGRSYSLGIEGSQVDTALAFNGSDTYIDIPDWHIPVSQGITFEAWVRFERFSGCSRVIDFGNGSGSHNIMISQYLNSKGLYIHFENATEKTDFVINDFFETNTWLHLAVSVAPDGMTIAYSNGVEAGRKQMPILADMTRQHCYIGKSHWQNELFKGQMDDIRLWSKVLSGQQIEQRYQQRLKGNEGGLLAYWQCRDDQLLELTGSSLNSQVRGTLKTAPSVISESAYTVFTEVGNRCEQSERSFPIDQWNHFSAVFDQSWALKFDGAGWLNAGNDPSLNQTGALTLEAYFQADILKNDQTLISKGSLNAAARSPYVLQVDAQGRLIFAFQDENGGTQRLASPAGTIQAETFHRVSVVRKENFANPVEGLLGGGTINISQLQNLNISVPGTGGVDTVLAITLHVDGHQVAAQTFRDLRVSGNDEALTLGGNLHDAGQGLEGCLAEVRVWSRALAPQELAVAVNGAPSGLLAHWKLEENTGNLAHDSSGANHARINGARWIRNPDPSGSTLSLFNNGVPLITHAKKTPLLLSERAEAVEQLTLGAMMTEAGPVECYSGTLEEVRLWKTVRTQEQLLDNLFTRLKGEKADLIANYCFDDQDNQLVHDDGLRGNHLQQSDSERYPAKSLSTAPVSNDTAQVRSALAGLRSAFHQRIDSAPAAQEYADLQYDAENTLKGIMKRCYSYIDQGQWKLITGYKVGNLVTEWIGQAQFDPQIMGYMEGTPPVPSENMTYGTNGTGTGIYEGDGSTVELIQATEVNYNYSASREHGFDASFETSMELGVEGSMSTLVAPFGFGVSIPFEFNLKAGRKTGFESSGGWVEEKNFQTGSVKSRSLLATLGGNWEDPDNMLNPELGRRWDSANMGFAVVQSETADVFALRLEHNNALVSFRFLPNPDIPRDWNIVSFPMNPRYCKQGTLDGKIGYDSEGRVVCDPSYPEAASYGEYSYYKPRQAYLLKRQIERQQQELASYYLNYKAAPLNGPVSAALRDSEALAGMLPGFSFASGRALTFGSQADASGAGAAQDNLGIRNSFSRRDIANTYVWTADGGIFKETEQTLDVVQETTGGNYNFTSSASGNMSVGMTLAAVSFNAELNASLSGSMNLTQAKAKESSQSFSIEANVTCSGDMQRHDPHTGDPIYDNGAPAQVTGRVDAYRWMTFYQQPSRRNFEELFNTVVDPVWLKQSDHPGAVALRQANQAERKPPCWRVNHIVTFVSRVLPEFVDDAAIPMATAMKKQNVNSNWELICKLEPFVRNKTADATVFAGAVRQALQQSLPELLPHADDVVAFLGDYYGVENLN